MSASLSKNYLVGIRCYTYNHAQYISDALNGFTMQQTTFPFIAMVVDDASTDGEQEVIAAYLEEHFDTKNSDVAYNKETEYAHISFAQHKQNKNCYIVVLYLKENLYSKKQNYKKREYLSEWIENIKYEALCEGDDYWTDPLKLQKQVDFLEANPEYGMCYTKVRRYDNTKRRFVGVSGGPSTTFEELLDRNTIPTLSIMMRQELHQCYQEDIHPENKGWKMGDYPMWLWIAYNSKIHFIDEATGVYRVLPESASHSKDARRKVQFILNSFEIQSFYAEYYMPDLKHHYDNRVLYWQAILLASENKFMRSIKLLQKVKNKSFKDLLRFSKYYICR